MAYMHLDNLYRPEAQSILLFREVYALEKIHGTSAHVRWQDGRLWLHSGGEKHERFVALFDNASLAARLEALGHPKVIVYGEAYGGSQQKQAWRYGEALRFVAFDVQIGDTWLAVPQAHDVVMKLGLEFVHYVKIGTDLASIDAERDAPSEQARRNGVEGDQPREGVVLRPLAEMTKSNGSRIMAKHKRDDERETKTPRKVVDASQLEVLQGAQAVADEWVTPTRLEHVLQRVEVDGVKAGPEHTRSVINLMLEDVLREGSGEFADSKETRHAICKKAATLFHARLRAGLRESAQ